MPLQDMVLGEWDALPGVEDEVHGFGVANDFLLVAAGKRNDPKIAQQSFDLAIGQAAAVDACGRPDTFDGDNVSQGGEALWLEVPQCPPPTLGLVDPRDEIEHGGSNDERGCIHHWVAPIAKNLAANSQF